MAVLSVVAYHAFPHVLSGGFVGVDVFFVISGFLISGIMFDNLESKRFTFSDFYGRRIRRIFPSLTVLFVAALVLGWISLFSSELKRLGLHVAGGAAFGSNLLLWRESGYFDRAAEMKPLLHLWSLGIEEQYYIIWPLVLWAIWRYRWRFTPVLVALILASFTLNVFFIAAHPSATFYLPATRVWELLIGSGLAFVKRFRPTDLARWTKGRETPLSAVGVALLLVGFFALDQRSKFPGWWAILPTMGAALIIAPGPTSWINRNLLSHRMLVWFGLVSYPLYLWHWMLLSFAIIVENGNPTWQIRLAAVLVSIGAAKLSYDYVEKPLRGGAHLRLKTAALVAAMVVVAGAGLGLYLGDGVPSRFQAPRELAYLEVESPDPAQNEACRLRYPELANLTACRLSRLEPPTLVIVGDSHVHYYLQALSQRDRDSVVMMLLETSCLPFSNADLRSSVGCDEKFSRVKSFLASQKSIKTVMLTGYWAYLLAGKFSVTEPGWRLPGLPSGQDSESFMAAGVELVDTLTKAGKEVVIVLDVPDLSFNIQDCFDLRPVRLSTGLIEPCAVSRADVQARSAPAEAILKELRKQFPMVRVLDPRQVLCDNSMCPAVRDGLPLYYNGDHLNQFGSGLVMDGLLRQLEQQRLPPRTSPTVPKSY